MQSDPGLPRDRYLGKMLFTDQPNTWMKPNAAIAKAKRSGGKVKGKSQHSSVSRTRTRRAVNSAEGTVHVMRAVEPKLQT